MVETEVLIQILIALLVFVLCVILIVRGGKAVQQNARLSKLAAIVGGLIVIGFGLLITVTQLWIVIGFSEPIGPYLGRILLGLMGTVMGFRITAQAIRS